MIPIKSAREVEKMRQACRTASDILDRVSNLVRPGISTKEIDEAAAVFMQEARVKSAFLGYRLGHRVFPGCICISLNDEVVHGIASQRRVQYGDIVKLDIGVIEDGWVGDTAATVTKALASAISVQRLKMKPGATAFPLCANLSATASAASCMKNLKSPITANGGAARASRRE